MTPFRLVVPPQIAAFIALAASLVLSGCAGTTVAGAPAPATADGAMQTLMAGNQRFVAGRHSSANSTPERRTALANTQKPFAIIVSCSDSRVGPEVVFDQGLGDIFVIRTAGQVLDAPGIGSIEYAVEHLGSQLIVVLGHERCGAVTAAVASGNAPGHIDSLVKAIRPSALATKGQPGDHVDNAVRENVRRVVRQLQSSKPILAEFVHQGKVKVVGAYYDLDTGAVAMVP